MRRKWRLQLNAEPLVIIPRRDLYPEEAATVEVSRLAAQLEGWLSDPLARQVVLDIFEWAYGRSAQTLKRDGGAQLQRTVRTHVEAAFRNRELVALTFPRPERLPHARQPPPPSDGGNAKQPPVRQKTWIEIELVDDTGQPVKGERYRIQTPDGDFINGVLDAQGRARVGDLDPGECEVCFPDLDARGWRASA
ncbi:MAG: hypothetical protein ACRD68_00695 [Pyrinomonadaceae bacterium]